MDNNASLTTLAFNAVVAAIDPTGHRHSSQNQGRWKRFWSRFLCFRYQKRDKRIAPASRLDTAPGSAHGWPPNSTAQAGLALAPPSSPASFITSSLQSPASLNLSFSAASVNVHSPPPNPMFTIGPYAHETQLVSPPAFSTFTTEPSTAPFTPPSELAHVMIPSSPDVPFAVPFAQLVASTLEAKASVRDTVSPYSGSSLASPTDIPTGELQFVYQWYPESPVSHLVSPGIRGSGTSSPAPAVEFPVKYNMMHSSPMSFFPTFESFPSLANNQPPCTLLSLPQSFEMESQQNITFFADSWQRDSAECEAEGKVGFRRSMSDIGTTKDVSIQKPDDLLPERGEKQTLKNRERDVTGYLIKSGLNVDYIALHAEYRTCSSINSEDCCKNIAESSCSKDEKDEMGKVQQIERPLEVIIDLNRSCCTNEDINTTSQLLQWPEEIQVEDCSKHDVRSNSFTVLEDKLCHAGELDHPNHGSQSPSDSEANTCRNRELNISSSEMGSFLQHATGKQRGLLESKS